MGRDLSRRELLRGSIAALGVGMGLAACNGGKATGTTTRFPHNRWG